MALGAPQGLIYYRRAGGPLERLVSNVPNRSRHRCSYERNLGKLGSVEDRTSVGVVLITLSFLS